MDKIDFAGVDTTNSIAVMRAFFEGPHTVTGQQPRRIETSEFRALSKEERLELADMIRAAYDLATPTQE